MKFKDRIKTYNFWTTLSAALILLLEALGRCFGFEIPNAIVNDIIMSICGVLVVLGVVTAPKKETKNQEVKKETPEEENNNCK